MRCEPILWMGLTDTELAFAALLVFVIFVLTLGELAQRRERKSRLGLTD